MAHPALYSATVPTFARLLGNAQLWLDKAIAHAEARKAEPNNFVHCRLIADMLPLKNQIGIATDFAKGATSRLAGIEVPKWDDNEATLADLRARCQKGIDYVGGFKPEQFVGAETRTIQLKVAGQDITIDGLNYVHTMVLPNFYFHCATAYGILRSNGVDLGKRDFIGQL